MWKSKGIRVMLVGLVIVTMLLSGGCNKAPTITSLTPSATALAPGESCTINCVASDPDGDTLTYAWSVTGGAVSGTGNNVSWTAPATLGSYTITVTVSDGEAAAVSESCEVQVTNTAPVITSLTSSKTDLPPGGNCTINCAASDADGDTLSYEWSATGGTITGTGSTVDWEAPAAEGTYTVSVEVDDGKGGTDSASCDITVEMKYGSIDIQSDPEGAEVYLDGVDTGNITPYVITNLAPGTYTVMLEYYHYKYREETVTVTANETTYINWSLDYAEQETLTLQPNATAGKDSGTTMFLPDANWGTDDDIDAGYGAWGLFRAYLEFDLSSLPANAVITSARLGLFYHATYGTTIAPIGAYAVDEAWSETTITWNNQPDPAGDAEYTNNVAASETNAFVNWYITDLVTGWYDGTIINYGVVLMDTDESSVESAKGFYSSDWTTAAERPKLVITYFDPTS